MESIKEKQNKIFDLMKADFHYKNKLETPRLQKVTVSCGIGSLKDKKKIDLIVDRLTKITGQKPSLRGAKKSIASFKVREGDSVGVLITLRGQRMYGFLDKLINVAFPRTKDFRGLNTKGIDNIGNLTIGIKEHTIFPETSDEDVRDIFGLAITVVSTAKDKKSAEVLFRHLGFPFSKGSE